MNKTSEALFRLDSRGIPAREPHSRQAWGGMGRWEPSDWLPGARALRPRAGSGFLLTGSVTLTSRHAHADRQAVRRGLGPRQPGSLAVQLVSVPGSPDLSPVWPMDSGVVFQSAPMGSGWETRDRTVAALVP